MRSWGIYTGNDHADDFNAISTISRYHGAMRVLEPWDHDFGSGSHVHLDGDYFMPLTPPCLRASTMILDVCLPTWVDLFGGTSCLSKHQRNMISLFWDSTMYIL